jgi:hypothetical protein
MLISFADECRRDLRGVDVLLAKIETVADGLARNSATKADVAQLEATLIKWLIGTTSAIAAGWRLRPRNRFTRLPRASTARGSVRGEYGAGPRSAGQRA